MPGQWEVAEYEPGDEQGIMRLYQLVFGEEMSDDQWRWRYLKNPTGLVTIILAKAGAQIVGQYALLPVRMKVGADTRVVALSLDTMVHPDYRGQGVFVELARRLYKDVALQGTPLVYGFPNEASHRGFVTGLGWVDLCDRVPLFVRPLSAEGILKGTVANRFLLAVGGRSGQMGMSLLLPARRIEVPDGCAIRPVTSFDDRADELWRRASSAFGISLVRDQRYLNWRYVEKPGDSYTILILERAGDVLGYVVLKSVERFGLRIGFVVDLLAVPDQPSISRCLISEAVECFRKAQRAIISCLMLKHSPYIQALRANGFLFLPARLHPQEMYVGVRRNTEEYAAELITNPSNWYITWGDHDDI